MARQAGISRAAVSAIETGTVVPSVEAALSLARTFETTVEQLFRGESPQDSPEVWAVEPRGGEAGYWEVAEGRRVLRYPVEAVAMNPFPPDVLSVSGRRRRLTVPVPTLTVACCDPAARFFAAAYEGRSGVRVLVLPRNGSEALDMVRRGVVHVGGVHASTPEDPEANLRRVRSQLGRGWVLLRVADWQTGIAHASGAGGRSVAALTRRTKRWAIREPGAAARELLESVLGISKPAGRVVRGHQQVADAVQAGWADGGVTVQLCAVEDGLGFLPLRMEGLDFVFREEFLGDARVKKLVSFVQSRAHRHSVAALPGYDEEQAGFLRIS